MNARLFPATLAAFALACLTLVGAAFAKPVCQIDQGCPAGAPVPQCTQAQKDQAVLFGKGISTRTPPKSGTRVQYMGILGMEAGCTEMACDGQCCNSCDGIVTLRGDSGLFGGSADHYSHVALTDDDPKRFKISGDDSLVCLPLALPATATVVVDGTFRLKDGQYSIHAPKICQF